MEKPRTARPSPPALPGAESCDGWLDHAQSLLLAQETEAALRWGAAVVARNSSAGALLLTSRLLEQMGRGRAAIQGLGLAVDRAVYDGNVPLAVAAIEDLRSMGADVGAHLDRLATAFCRGSARLEEPALPLTPLLEDLQPLSSFLAGPALASAATQILQGAAAARDETADVEPPKVEPLPLFSALGREALRDLLQAFQVITVPAGHCVMSEGEPGTAAYIVARGELEVRRPRSDGACIVGTRLGQGAFFGEIALLSQLPSEATIVASRPSILLVARREALQAVAARHPEVASELAAHCRRRLVANLGRAAPLLAMLPARERALLIEQCETRTFEKGEKVMTEGEEALGLHLVAAGEVVVVAREGQERVMLATLSGGDTLGEVELVLRRRTNADAIAVRPTTTLFLPRGPFLALAAEHPAIAHGLYMTALRRDAEVALAMVAPAAVADGDLLEDPVAPAGPAEVSVAHVEPVHPVPMPVTVAPLAVARVLPVPALPVGSVAVSPVAPVAAIPFASTMPPTSVSRRPPPPRRRSFALPAMIGAGAFAAVAAIPVALAVLLGRHGDSSAAGALEARNAVAAAEVPAGMEPAVEVAAVKPTTPTPVSVKSAAPAVRPRAAASAAAHTAPSSTAAPGPEPRRTRVPPAPGGSSARTDEFGGRE